MALRYLRRTDHFHTQLRQTSDHWTPWVAWQWVGWALALWLEVRRGHALHGDVSWGPRPCWQLCRTTYTGWHPSVPWRVRRARCGSRTSYHTHRTRKALTKAEYMLQCGPSLTIWRRSRYFLKEPCIFFIHFWRIRRKEWFSKQNKKLLVQTKIPWSVSAWTNLVKTHWTAFPDGISPRLSHIPLS